MTYSDLLCYSVFASVASLCLKLDDMHKKTNSRNILQPDSTFRMLWDLFILILVLYVSIVIPLRIGFSTTASTSDNLFFRDEGIYFGLTLAIDFAFAIDVILNFR